jgi:hypothetical protein
MPSWRQKIFHNLIAELLETVPLPANPYTELHRHLLAAYQQMDIRGVEQLHQMPPLDPQKSSELIAEMLRCCPKGQENNVFLNCLFLNKLYRELRILLSEADMVDKQALGTSTRPLWGLQLQAGKRCCAGGNHCISPEARGGGTVAAECP